MPNRGAKDRKQAKAKKRKEIKAYKRELKGKRKLLQEEARQNPVVAGGLYEKLVKKLGYAKAKSIRQHAKDKQNANK